MCQVQFTTYIPNSQNIPISAHGYMLYIAHFKVCVQYSGPIKPCSPMLLTAIVCNKVRNMLGGAAEVQRYSVCSCHEK